MSDTDEPFGRYEFLERIAVGGMAEVFRARATGVHGFEKIVAVKRILPALATRADFVQRFVSEAKLAATLNHANIVHVLDFSRMAGSLYIAMEYVDGIDLRELLRAQREPLPLPAVLHVAISLFKGLEFAHGHSIVHRDISPSNILVSRTGEVKIVDFGIAQAVDVKSTLTATTSIVGKCPYMSPEQASGTRVDQRSDVFSAATVVYELLTLRRLFTGDNAADILDAVKGGVIEPPSRVRDDLPPALDQIVMAALQRDRERRSRTDDVLRALVDLSYAHSLPATEMALRPLVAPLCGEARSVDEPQVSSARLIDEILCSELGGGDKSFLSRLTEAGSMAAAARGTARLSMQRGDLNHEGLPELTIVEWTGATGTTAPVATTSAALAPPPTPSPPTTSATGPVGAGAAGEGERPSRWRTQLAAAVVTLCLGGLLLLLWLGREESSSAVAPAVTLRATSERRDATEREPPPPLKEIVDARADTAKAPVYAADAAVREAVDAADTPGDTAVDAADAGARSEDRAPPVGPRAAPRTGQIDLFAKPWAEVYFRGKRIATAPKQGLRLPVGKHRLRLVNPLQHRETTIVVTVPSSQPYHVALPPAKGNAGR